jgi:hypothetical protein
MFARNFDLILDPAIAMQIAMLVRQFDTEDIDPSGESYSGDEAVADAEELLEKEKEDDHTDPFLEELHSVIDALNVDAQRDLLALMWVGRGDFRPEDWSAARHQAVDTADIHLATYLAETPLASDYLVEGLSQMGYAVDDYAAS